AGGVRYAAVTSCIQLVFQLDATHVVTVEGLRDGPDLNPIQGAMAGCHGPQRGYCRPGFVAALYGLMHDGRPVDAAAVRRGLAEWRRLRIDGDALYVGAGSTLAALEQAALAHLPELGRFLAWFGSPLIKNAGTLGGNLVTGSPIGDTIPALTVLGAEIDLAGV